MLSDEPVPQADSVLAALAKHLEAKLSFGEKRVHFLTGEQNTIRVSEKVFHSIEFILLQKVLRGF